MKDKLETYIVVLEDVLESSDISYDEEMYQKFMNVGKQYLSMTKYNSWNGYNYLEFEVIKTMNVILDRQSDLVAIFNTSAEDMEIFLGVYGKTFVLPKGYTMILPNNKLFDFLTKKKNNTDLIVVYYKLLRVEDEGNITN